MDLSKAKVTSREILSQPKWLKLELVHYTDPTGVARDWECCSRATRVEGSDCDGVAVVATFNTSEGRQILLQKQFRVPIEGVCVELPAGLLDPKETLEECAIRELKEETGYIGKATKISPVLFNDPGFCNCNLKVVYVDIDMEDERNKNPQPQLEDNEFIETFHVTLAKLPELVEEFANQGLKIDTRVAGIAQGIELAREF